MNHDATVSSPNWSLFRFSDSPIAAISGHLMPTFPRRKSEAASVAPTMACVADTGILKTDETIMKTDTPRSVPT